MADNWPKDWPVVVWPDVLKIFDPEGDVLLKLQQDEEDTFDGGSEASDISPVVDVPQELDRAVLEEVSQGAMLPPDSMDDLHSPSSQQPTLTGENTTSEEGATEELEDDLAPGDTPKIYLRVSSRHLILASRMFSKMLGSDNFSEGKSLCSKGNLLKVLPDDPEALAILMHIVHGMTRQVPRSVNLDTLVRLAILIDYYYLLEVVELFSDMWIADLKPKVFPRIGSPNVVQWLFISWVFHKEDIFSKITQNLISGCDDKLLDAIRHESIPIPSSISDKIQEYRNKAIEETITIVHNYITKYLSSDILCSNGRTFACDAKLLGSLIKGSAMIGIWPPPEVPYHGIAFCTLAEKVRGIHVLDSCEQDRYHGHVNGHKVKHTIDASIKSLEDQYCGLKLEDFIPRTQGKTNKITSKMRLYGKV